MSTAGLEESSRKAVLEIHDTLQHLIAELFRKDYETFRRLHPQWLDVSALLEDRAQRKLFLEELGSKSGYSYMYSALLQWMFDVWDLRKSEPKGSSEAPP